MNFRELMEIIAQGDVRPRNVDKEGRVTTFKQFMVL